MRIPCLLCFLSLALPVPAYAQTPAAAGTGTAAAVDAAHARRPVLGPDRSADAIQLFDANGKLVGRLHGRYRAMLKYQGEPLAVVLTLDKQVPDGAFEWENGPVVYYESGDCSGQDYVPFFPYGTNFVGTALKEDGHTTLLISDARKAVKVPILSIFDAVGARCVVLPRPSLTLVMQIEARVALDELVTEPMSIR